VKKLIIGLGVLLVLTACGTDSAKVDGTSEPKQEEEVKSEAPVETGKEENKEAETKNEAEKDGKLEVGETREDSNGSFTLVARNGNESTFETGPMILTISQVNAISAQVKGDLADFMETDALEYIQIDMQVENTSEDTITFYASQATITTNTGEQLESDMWLSDHIDGDFIGAVKKNGSQFFVLQNSKAEDIEWVRVIISAPNDENWDNVGEKLDFKIEF
jgi:uncharacterized lipoprotein